MTLSDLCCEILNYMLMWCHMENHHHHHQIQVIMMTMMMMEAVSSPEMLINIY
jgi:hypothetical protein